PSVKSSSLFPYTTLCRSQELAGVLGIGPALEKRLEKVADNGQRSKQYRHDQHDAHTPALREHIGKAAWPECTKCHPRRGPKNASDRKSTRLNSSHVSISY